MTPADLAVLAQAARDDWADAVKWEKSARRHRGAARVDAQRMRDRHKGRAQLHWLQVVMWIAGK